MSSTFDQNVLPAFDSIKDDDETILWVGKASITPYIVELVLLGLLFTTLSICTFLFGFAPSNLSRIILFAIPIFILFLLSTLSNRDFLRTIIAFLGLSASFWGLYQQTSSAAVQFFINQPHASYSVYISVLPPTIYILPLVYSVLGAGVVFWEFSCYSDTRYAYTNKRILKHHGIKGTTSLNFEEIQNIKSSISIIERFFHVGTVNIFGKNKKYSSWEYLNEFDAIIKELQNKI